jgi:hypothetical protein
MINQKKQFLRYINSKIELKNNIYFIIFNYFSKENNNRLALNSKYYYYIQILLKKIVKKFKKYKKLIYYYFKKRVNNTYYYYLGKVFNKLYFKNINIVNISIRSCKNNVFYSLYKKSENISNLLSLHRSAGIYKIKISKKTQKYFFKILTRKFFKEVRNHIKTYNAENFIKKYLVIINIKLPYYLRLFSINKIKKLFKKSKLLTIINLSSNKIFNGCKAKKQRRKKRIYMRYYKA